MSTESQVLSSTALGVGEHTKPAQNNPTDDDEKITVLSIDGGGVRGIIPAKILWVLEEMLQEKYHEDARIADYFDIIAGTSAGSIIAAKLATPDINSARPCLASEIVNIFRRTSSRIFPEYNRQPYSGGWGWWNKLKDGVRHAKYFHRSWGGGVEFLFNWLARPAYKREGVNKVAEEVFQDCLLHETLGRVVIPAFSMNKFGPYIFSTEQAKERAKNYGETILTRDAVLSSTAAPVLFDPHDFHLENSSQLFADGGLVANNPTLLALAEAAHHFETPLDSKRYLVLSLGTGTTMKQLGQNDNKKLEPVGNSIQLPSLSIGGKIFWFLQFVRGIPLIVDVLMDSLTNVIDTYVSRIFTRNKNNYLRIQEYSLRLGLYATDEPSKIGDLEKVADDLLNKEVTQFDPLTGKIEMQEKRLTYKEALSDFADELYKQRQKKIQSQK